VEADEIGASLRNASAKVTRAARTTTAAAAKPATTGGEADPWAGQGSGGYTDEPPF
jgi:single-strand DNA-binding protein